MKYKKEYESHAFKAMRKKYMEIAKTLMVKNKNGTYIKDWHGHMNVTK